MNHAGAPSGLASDELERFQRRALLVGLTALGAAVLGGVLNPTQFFQSYLVGYVLWIGVSLGGLAIVMLHHLTGGAWGFLIRRPLEAASRTLPLMAALFLPLLLGLPYLYEWARPEAVAADPILQHKAPYLNVPFFTARAVLYFGAWIGLAVIFDRWSRAHDDPAHAGSLAWQRRFRLLGAPGLLIYGLTATFASFDWLMSLEPHWFSSIFGVLFMGGHALSAMAFAIAVLFLVSRERPMADVIEPSHVHDLGKLLLAFVMLWAYFAFSQFLIIWSGNLPEEIPWYLDRLHGGWQWVGLALVVGHFGLPFLLLLSRDLKRDAGALARVAAAILAMRFVDLFWTVTPALHHDGLRLHWIDIAAAVGLGGVWVAAYVSQLRSRPLLPLHDPYFKETFEHGAE